MLPGDAISAMVRALRELVASDRPSAEEAKSALYSLSVAELDAAIETYETLASLGRKCRALHDMLRNSSLGVEMTSTEEAARRLGVIR